MGFKRFIALLVACGLAAGAVWLTPRNLVAIGLMDASLTSDVALTRRVAEIEVAVARVVLFVLAAVTVTGAVFWTGIERSARYHRLLGYRPVMPAAYERELRRLTSPEALILIAALVGMLGYIRFGAGFIPTDVLWTLNAEDGALETASAIILIVAAGLSGVVACNVGRGHPRFIFHAMLAALFVVMCGEEISWGQRLLGFDTPEGIKAVNVQAETNLHNMFGYLFDHVFILGFLTWAAIIPLGYHLFRPVRQMLLRIGFPVPSIGLAFGMTAVGLMLDPVVYAVMEPMPTLRLAEARETLSAVAFLLVMREVARHAAPRRLANEPASSAAWSRSHQHRSL
ncbi:hypothetical protein [Roseovarius sp. SYSU LYC5161]|uniref:hypothetical protein n=1 Tax=Roseovarius halophilus (ex Wu et al. 2025) TaxID=3376060 RepID=UPI0028728CF6|nr:hypothetical protein [Roseovarius sp.]